MKVRLVAVAMLLQAGPSFADGVGVGAGQDPSGRIFFVSARGANSQLALDKARVQCLAKYQNCIPLVQIDTGCVTVVSALSPSGVHFFQGATRQEALLSCSVGGDSCFPPLDSITECTR